MNIIFTLKSNIYMPLPTIKKIVPFLLLICFWSTILIAQEPTLESNVSKKDSIVSDSTFTIADAPLKSYKGVYKNNLPYSGYFKMGTKDFFWIDFYAQGRKTVQYSYDFLKDTKLEEEEEDFQNRKKVLDFKSTFRDSKIVNGFTYTILPKTILTKKYISGDLIEAAIDIFEIHYYNRITIKKFNKTVVVTNLRDSVSTLRIVPQHGILNMSVNIGEERIAGNHKNDCNFERPKRNSLLRTFQVADRQTCFSITNEMNMEPYSLNFSLLQTFMKVYPLGEDQTVDLNTLVDAVIGKTDSETLSVETIDDEILLTGYVTAASTGGIEKGIFWTPFEEDSGMYKIFESGRMTEKGLVTLSDFQELMETYLKNQE